MENNEKLREEMRVNGISQWMMADALGVSENTVNRWMRHPLPPEKERLFLNAIEHCKGKKGR